MDWYARGFSCDDMFLRPGLYAKLMRLTLYSAETDWIRWTLIQEWIRMLRPDKSDGSGYLTAQCKMNTASVQTPALALLMLKKPLVLPL